MPTVIPGSEIFEYQPKPRAELRQKVAAVLPLHEVDSAAAESVDLPTYEILRHRIWSATQEMGDAIKRMSGSIIVTDANDFNFAILDEMGDVVQLGLFLPALSVALGSGVKWTLEHRSENPGIEDGDMFLCNDPWVGGGMHQNDVSVLAPVFWESKLFGWVAAVAHQLDVGGVAPGSWSPRSTSVFWESLPTPPVKIVRHYQIQRDVEEVYLRRSRIPKLVALDLRAKIGANSLGMERIKGLIRKYGPDTVKAVMKRMMDDAERRLRAKLRQLSDGAWRSVEFQEQAHEGDRGAYKIILTMTKKDDHLTFDFRGTDPQVEGLINCTYNGMVGGIIQAMLPLLCGDIPWAVGGILRCFDVISEEGTLNNAHFPAGICKASVASAWATWDLAQDCLSKMLETHPEHCKSAMSVCMGTWALAVIAGTDQRRNPFVSMLMDPMATGTGARTDQDGVDTGAQLGHAMVRAPDVEMEEFMVPVLYLWRREETDSGGPGKYRGGVGGSLCFVPHATEDRMSLVVSGSGKAISMNMGLSGGYPGNTQVDLTSRHCQVKELFRRGMMPSDVSELGGEAEYQPCENESYLDPSDAHFMYWQTGAGYMDPLLRDPEQVRADFQEYKVSAPVVRDIYGVVLRDGEVDADRTATLRKEIRANRRRRAKAPPPVTEEPRLASLGLPVRQRWDDNLAEVDENGQSVLQCQHCGCLICRSNEDYLKHLALIEDKPQAAGPQVFAESWRYLDEEVVFRQYCCPNCFTAFLTQVVPRDFPELPERVVGTRAA